VSDTGIGMDEETQKRIFEPMFTTKDPGKGTGLGLSMVSRIIETHQGMIRVASRLGQGATFTIYLPIAEARTKPLKVNTTLVLQHLHEQDEPAERRSGLVLLQEQDDLMRQRAARALCSLGYEVLFAETVEEVLQLFEQYRAEIKLVVLHSDDPSQSDDIRQRLRALNPTIRVIFAGSDEDISTRARIRLLLPCDTRTFQQAITSAMEDEE